MAVLPALAWLVSIALAGIALLDRLAPYLSRLERLAYGSVLGMVLGSLALVPAAAVVGFSTELVIVEGSVALATAALLERGRLDLGWAFGRGQRASRLAVGEEPSDPVPIDRSAAIAVVLIGLRFATLWADALTIRPDGLWAGHEYIWSDWPTHLGIVSSFAYGDNFPPEHTLFAGLPLAYHYLSDLTPAAFVVLGLTPIEALPLHSFVLSVVVSLAIWAFVRRLSGRSSVATLGLVLFLFGGSPGWLATAAEVGRSGDLVGTLANRPWDYAAQKDLHIRWFNPYLAFLMSQRAYLYGLPLMMLALTLVLVGIRRSRGLPGPPWSLAAWRTAMANGRLLPPLLAGVVAGLLPLSHLPTLLAMAILVPPLAILLVPRPGDLLGPGLARSVPWVGWLAFGIPWVLVSLPQLASQLGGGPGALSAFRVQLGWVAGEAPYFDAWPLFWLKNLGLFGPLLVVGLALPLVGVRLVPPRAYRLLLAFQAIFVVGNVFVFQPWDWDNHKILTVWFLSVATVVAAVIVWAWRRWRGPLVRLGLGLVVVSLVASPILEHLHMLEGRTQFRMLSTEQLRLAEEVRRATPPGTLVVTGMQSHDPIMMLSGRRLLMGYWGQLWVSGIPYEARQAEVATIYAGGPAAEALIARYGVGAVVIGPDERSSLGANEAWFAARYPVVAETEQWRVYGTGPLSAAPATPAVPGGDGQNDAALDQAMN
ncbi:MAG TPA: hypothetical protein VNO86_08520 [Candidatus Binatia bacterium]|nr:hypothetical protein [Candidatus Binatia bacterium]